MQRTTPDNQQEIKFLLGLKSKTGICSLIASLGFLLCLIGLFCPLCSYNPTVLDDLKRTVGFSDMTAIFHFGILFLVASFLSFYFFCVLPLSKKEWKSKTKKISTGMILFLVFAAVSLILVIAACVFYEIPEEKWQHLELKMEVGFYLFCVGMILFACSASFFCLLLKNLAKDRISLQTLSLSQNTTDKNNTPNQTLSDKLTELQKLKEQNILTEEEYSEKKEELLKQFK